MTDATRSDSTSRPPDVVDVDPDAAGIDPAALDHLRAKVREQVDEGRMPACQLAVGADGGLAVFESYGEATPSTRFAVFSATKAFVGGVVWQLLGEGSLRTDTRVVEVLGGFGRSGRTPEWMAQVTVEQLLTHTSGFPYAPLGPPRWDTRAGRLEAMSRWHANHEPGTHFEYHPTAAHWVLAEMIAEVEGADHREVLRRRLLDPLGLDGFSLGAPLDDQDGIAELVIVGEPATHDELVAVFGDIDTTLFDAVAADMLLVFNQPEVREVGVPGAGGIGTAADLARYYQALLHDPSELWDPDVLADATGRIRCTLPDPMLAIPANRSLGLCIAGDDGNGALRGTGPTVSPRAFGHNGAAGQIAWADPDTGVSFALVTSGIDPNQLREARRILSLAARAGRCATPRHR